MNKKINVDAIYILHYPKLIDRKKFMLDQLVELGIENEVTWVEEFGPEEIKEEYNNFLNNFEKKSTVLIEQSDSNYNYINTYNEISIGNYSLCMKHRYCYHNQVENNFENIIIFEDDAVLSSNFIEVINGSIEEFKNENEFEYKMEFLVMGDFLNWSPKNLRPNKYIHYGENQKSRCAHAQVSNIEFAKKSLKYWDNINNPPDFILNEIFQLENIKVAWLVPGLSQYGFKTTL